MKTAAAVEEKKQETFEMPVIAEEENPVCKKYLKIWWTLPDKSKWANLKPHITIIWH